MKTIHYLCLQLCYLLFCLIACNGQENPGVSVLIKDETHQDSIIEEYLKNGAWKHHLYSREWQKKIDEGLQQDSTIAYLWQQKAMPLFKQGKYELGMIYIDKAVLYDPDRWQDYRAFIKCIFAKTYRAALLDFEACKARMGNSYVMDHSYNFYIALCHLMLNEFEKAEVILAAEIEMMKKEKGEEWLHYLDLFYYGIALYEQRRYEEAILIFDRSLNLYPQFSDGQYYKAMCLNRLGNKEEAYPLFDLAKANAAAGYTMTEDNVIYERYPYQIRWKF